MGELMGGESWEEKVWRAGCYAVGYNVPTAEVIWSAWPWPSALEDAPVFESWVREHWEGFGLRRERRAVRTPSKYTRCLLSYAEWLASPDKDWWYEPDFPRAWAELNRVWGMGRYVLLKLNEVLCRYADGAFRQTDIRAQGGRSPREGLALLWPEHAAWLLGGDDIATVRQVEALATETRERLSVAYGVEPSWFIFQVVLCEYKKCWLGRQYPGRTHDTELRYLREVQRYWGNATGILDARAAVFPHEALGELQGWHGARENLEETLPRYRYTWSDLKYDYALTADPAHPVPR